MSYKEELLKSMDLLASDPRTIIVGQNVKFGGTSMYHTFKQLPENQRLEVPVFEEVQAGLCTGLALEGFIPVCIYPRMDFMILAVNQIINHLDKMEEMSDGQFKPKVIIRACVGSIKPLMPGPQHSKNYTEAFKSMVTNIDVVELLNAEDIYPAYTKALNSDKSTILIEHSDLYNSDLTAELKEARAQPLIK